MTIHFPAILAGMPMPLVKISEAARPRLDVISFFLLTLLLSALVVMLVWNSLRSDFPRLPRLSFLKACGVVVLWGLLFVVVLTMISGARELMTPGAWVKQGSTYKLRETELSVANRQAKLVSSRVERLRELHRHLTLYADGHDGAYPPSQEGAGIDYSHWRIVDLPPGTSLVYVPGRRRQGPPQPLAYEPEVYDSDPFVLLTDGRIEPMRPIEIKRLVEAIQ